VARLLAAVDDELAKASSARSDRVATATALALRRALVETAYAAGLRISELRLPTSARSTSGVPRSGHGRGRGRIGLLGRPAVAALATYLAGRPSGARGARPPRPPTTHRAVQPPLRARRAWPAPPLTGCAVTPACPRASPRIPCGIPSPHLLDGGQICASSGSCSPRELGDDPGLYPRTPTRLRAAYRARIPGRAGGRAGPSLCAAGAPA
jgi:hypothetical protein